MFTVVVCKLRIVLFLNGNLCVCVCVCVCVRVCVFLVCLPVSRYIYIERERGTSYIFRPYMWCFLVTVFPHHPTPSLPLVSQKGATAAEQSVKGEPRTTTPNPNPYILQNVTGLALKGTYIQTLSEGPRSCPYQTLNPLKFLGLLNEALDPTLNP